MLCQAEAVTSEKVRVVVGDDHPMFREGVVRALVSSGEIEAVAEAEDGTEALALIREHQPQVALLDYRMPGMDGAEVAAAVTRDEPPTRVLLVSAHDESAIVYKALQQGAAGFLSKESSRSELVSAVVKCAKGKDVITPELAAGLASEIRRRNEPDVPALSPREREVLKLIAAGTSIPRWPRSCSSLRRRSRPTCNGSTRSWASTTEAPRWQKPCAANCWISRGREEHRQPWICRPAGLSTT